MADLAKTYNSSDWELYVYVPEEGAFTLDFSQLDGPDVLGTNGGGNQLVDAQIANLVISEGSEIFEGIFSTITPATMQAELVIENFTASDANKFFVGTECSVALRNPTPTYSFTISSFTGSLENQTFFFVGFIESFNVNVVPGSNFANISISAISKTSRDLNTLIGVEKNTTTPKNTLIANTGVGNWVGEDLDNYNFGVTDFEEKSLGEFLGDLVLCESALAADKMAIPSYAFGLLTAPSVLKFYPETNQRLELTNETIAGTPSVDFDDSDVSSIGLDWSGAGSPTGVAFTLYSDPETTYNFGESNSPGAFVFSATPDVKDLTQLQAVARKMLNFNKSFAPINIVTETARTYQTLTFREQNLPIYFPFETGLDFWLYPTNLAKVLDTITITNTELGYTDLPMIVTGRTIEVTPDNWTTTYNLWKGFTN